MPKDQTGNEYFEVGNIRVTALDRTWDGVPGIRIQAYKGTGKSLFLGAELPIKDRDTAYEFIRAIVQALEVVGI